ncbi:MAG: hypothetical protein FWC71_07105 [Defluviitaleaceae bacterium]|nr:hypothetical protein [Defluviitaleaceae bacterium]
MESVFIQGVEIRAEVSENYIQINDVSEADLRKIWSEVCVRFAGFELNFCFRNVAIPEAALAEIGAEVLEDCLRMVLAPADFVPAYNYYSDSDYCGVEPLEDKDFDTFARMHDALPDMYWTSARVRDKRDIWGIFVLYNMGIIIGYSMIMTQMRDETMAEIFAVETAEGYQHVNPRSALVSAAVAHAFKLGKQQIIYMVDSDNPLEKEAAEAVGFTQAGFYIGYTVRKIGG